MLTTLFLFSVAFGMGLAAAVYLLGGTAVVLLGLLALTALSVGLATAIHRLESR